MRREAHRMETFSVAHRNLQMFCADFWEDPASCVVILNEIGISPSAVDMTPPAIMRWYSIIRHLMRLNDGSMSRLVVALMGQYPANDALRSVCSPWIPSQPMTGNAKGAKQPDHEADKAPFVLPEGTVLVEEFDPVGKPKKSKETPAPPVVPPVVPLVAPVDFADEADAVVPKMETLWATVIEQDRRIKELERRWTELYEWRNNLFGGKAQT